MDAPSKPACPPGGHCGACCGGGAGGCGGAAGDGGRHGSPQPNGQYLLCAEEIAVLEALGQYAFLPVFVSMDPRQPYVALPDEPWTVEPFSEVVSSLLAKGLLDLDESAPLGGSDYGDYAAALTPASVGLTARGQEILPLLPTD